MLRWRRHTEVYMLQTFHCLTGERQWTDISHWTRTRQASMLGVLGPGPPQSEESTRTRLPVAPRHSYCEVR